MDLKIMTRLTIIFFMMLLSVLNTEGKNSRVIVADSVTHAPLPGASIFDQQGKFIGISNNNGKLPDASANLYPLTIRYLGYKEKHVEKSNNDTVFLTEISTELPEVVIESRQHKILHVLAYVREYSTLSTYSDSVFLFREKMVDYMLPSNKDLKFKGWSTPRILKSKSYYRFTNSQGLDSVSDKCNHHFSWSDWVGIIPSPQMAKGIRGIEHGSDTLWGKYSTTETWIRHNDKVNVDVNVLADTSSRKWVPNLSVFFKNRLDFENFRLRCNYNNVVGDSIHLTDLTRYSFNIESNGRGLDMFRFNHKDEPFFVNTYAEVYILDKEYISVKEAKKWDKRKFDANSLKIIEPAESPDLQPSIKELIARVNAIKHDNVRLDFTPDQRLKSRGVQKQNFGQRALFLLKQLTGISYVKYHRNLNNRWDSFKKDQIQKNNGQNE